MELGIACLLESTTYEAHQSADIAYDAGHGWSEYFTRSGRRASGFVLVAKWRTTDPPQIGNQIGFILIRREGASSRYCLCAHPG